MQSSALVRLGGQRRWRRQCWWCCRGRSLSEFHQPERRRQVLTADVVELQLVVRERRHDIARCTEEIDAAGRRRVADVWLSVWSRRRPSRLLPPQHRLGQLHCKGTCSSLWITPWQSYGASPAIWDDAVLPATRHRWARPALTPAVQAATRFTYPGRMEGWVDLVTRKRSRRELNSRPLGPESNALTSEPPNNLRVILAKLRRCTNTVTRILTL